MRSGSLKADQPRSAHVGYAGPTYSLANDAQLLHYMLVD